MKLKVVVSVLIHNSYTTKYKSLKRKKVKEIDLKCDGLDHKN